MTTTEQFTSKRIVKQAFADALAMFSVNKSVLMMLFAVWLAQLAGSALMVLLPLNNPIAAIATNVVYAAVFTYMAAPAYVAVHRYVVLREATPVPWNNYSDLATKIFWAWSLVLQLVFLGLSLVSGLASLMLTGSWNGINVGPPVEMSGSHTLIMFVTSLTIGIIALRFMTLAPMAALQPDHVSPRLAFQQTSGHFGKIIGIVLLLIAVFIPVALGIGIAVAVLGALAGPANPWLLVIMPVFIQPVLALVITIVSLSIASQFYMHANQMAQA